MPDNVDQFGLPLWPAAERNKQPILDELVKIVPATGGVWLEIAAATGQHALHFAPRFSQYRYQPSDYEERHLATLIKRQLVARLDNLLPPVRLDVTDEIWPLERADVIYNANMIHIAPFNVAEGLFRGAGRLLSAGNLLITYGPYMFDGVHTAPSNEQFDASLRARDPTWGIRDVSELRRLGEAVGLILRPPLPMPANNFLLVWDKT
jgi:hypothetical protein